MRPIDLPTASALPAITIYGPRPDPTIGAVIERIGYPISFAPDAGTGRAIEKSAARFSTTAPGIAPRLDVSSVKRIIDSVFDPSERHRLLHPWIYKTTFRRFDLMPRERRCFQGMPGDLEDAAHHLLPYYRTIMPSLPLPLESVLELRAALKALLPKDAYDLPEEYGLGLRNLRSLTGKALLLSHVMSDVDYFRFMDAHTEGIATLTQQLDSWTDYAHVDPYGEAHLRCDAILMRAASLYADGIEKLLKEQRCSPADLEKSLALLRSPLFQEGMVGSGHAGTLRYAARIAAEVNRLVHTAHERHEHRLSIVLGGTLFPELESVAEMVKEALIEKHRAQGKQLPFEEWVESWDLSILGYSIDLQFLRAMQKKTNEAPFPGWLKRAIRLEYIDLLDSFQWPRILAERPQLIAVIRSLYIAKTFDALTCGHAFPLSTHPSLNMKFAQSLCFADFAMRILPEGGVFLTEPGTGVLPHHAAFQPAMDGKTFTGIMVKSAG